MSDRAEYIKDRLNRGLVTHDELGELIELAQAKLGVMPDGYPGPVTMDALRRHLAPRTHVPGNRLLFRRGDWLEGEDVVSSSMHPSWYGAPFAARPLGIVVHTSATAPGTAVSMGKWRSTPFGTDPDHRRVRVSSWHFSVETDGTIVQHVPLTHAAWHAGSPSSRRLPFGWANYTALGVEIISPNDKGFPEEQVRGAERLWRHLVRAFDIPRSFAMIPHGWIDPARRVDPGPEWMGEPAPYGPPTRSDWGTAFGHAARVLDAAYAP